MGVRLVVERFGGLRRGGKLHRVNVLTNFLVPGTATESLETRIAYVLVQDSAVQRYSVRVPSRP